MTELRNQINNIVEEKNVKIIPDNLKAGIEAFGVTGTFTADATATPEDIAEGKTAYSNGGKITGTMPVNTHNATMDESLLNTISIDTSLIKNLVTEIPPLNLSSSNTRGNRDLSNVFMYCYYLKKAKDINVDGITIMQKTFNYDTSLEEVELLNSGNVYDWQYTFTSCMALTDVSVLDMSGAKYILSLFDCCRALENLGGFLNLGKAYTEKSSNYSNYTLELSSCTQLTHESLMNVINNLYDLNLTYDVANGGTLYTQKLTLGSTNLAKLTADEIAIATNKGWTVS